MQQRNLLANGFFLLSLLAALTGCEPPDEPSPQGPDCGYDLPAVPISDGRCEPDFLNFTDLDAFSFPEEPALVTECGLPEQLQRKFRVQTPLVSDPRLSLHLYRGTRALAQIQFFGTLECGDSGEPLTGCIPLRAAVQKVKLENLGRYKQIYGVLTYATSGLRSGDFISLAAYTRELKNDRVPYRGIDRQNGIEYLLKSCDGENYQRVIVSSCDPAADLDAWDAWIGLPRQETFEGRGGKIAAYVHDEGTSTRKTSKTVRRIVVDANDTGTSVSTDKALRQPLPSNFKDQDRQQPKEALACREFDLGARATPSQGKNYVIVNIDSGVELGGAWDGIWYHHGNQSVNGRFTQAGSLGYDFFFADFTPEDNWGHGTSTGGAMIGAYRGSHPLTVIHYKIFGPNGEVAYFGALVALHVAVENGADIINASWGEVNNDLPEAMECAIAYAQSEGVRVFTSAGNDRRSITYPVVGDSRPQWPASFTSKYDVVTTVTSYQFPGTFVTPNVELEASYANFSDKQVTLAAFMTAQAPEYGTGGFYYPLGTSISSPLAAIRYANVLAGGGNYGDYRSIWSQNPGLKSSVYGGYFLDVCD